IESLPTSMYSLSLPDALPIYLDLDAVGGRRRPSERAGIALRDQPSLVDDQNAIADRLDLGEDVRAEQDRLVLRELLDELADLARSEEHTSELQSRENLVCRLL